MSKEKSREVIYKFYLPDNQEDLEIFDRAFEYRDSLVEIFNLCRNLCKYDDTASEEMKYFAEKIMNLSDVFDS